MAFISKNEIEQFCFDDCQISDININEKRIEMSLDGLIVGQRNTQNANFTNSYADTTSLLLNDAKIESITIAGYSVYDADDNLLEKIEDEVVSKSEYKSVIEKIKGAYLYRMLGQMEGERYVYDLEIEQYTESGIPDLRDDAYIIRVSFKESIFTWERYLNRVN